MSTLSDISIRRPVFAWMLMIALIVFGAISFFRLGVSQMPDVDFPVLNVSVSWEGAAPEIMETELADKFEAAVISVQGLREISSNIKQGSVNITLEFDLDRDIDAALQEVQANISKIRLPKDVEPPTITKSNPDDQPIMWIGISSTQKSLREIINFVDLSLKDQFQIVPGVGEIILSGFSERNLRVWVDNNKLVPLELTILDIQRALEAGHIEAAAGRIENSKQELNLRMMGEGYSPPEVGEILITERGGRPIFGATIRIKDVATVEDGLADIRRVSRVNGVPGVGLGIKKQRGANAVDVGKRVTSKMEELRPTLPKDVAMGINFDSTRFIKESIEETEFTLLLSAIATAIVCWLFLGSWVSTFNILLSIPTSIVGSFTVIYFFGFTLNFFTILGLALAIGIVVDDAIMVLENIYRHRDMGKSTLAAARDGAREITFAAVAASVAVMAIFLPVAFMKGIIGKFFFQFGVTITTAVALSLLEAITLTPMRCSQFMESSHSSSAFVKMLNDIFQRLANLYRKVLEICLRWRWTVIILSTAVFIWSLSLMGGLRKEFIPSQDQSMFLMRVQTPLGSSLEYTSTVLKSAEEYIKSRPEVIRYFGAVGGFGGGEVNTGMIFVTLVPRAERSLPQSKIMEEFRAELQKVKDLKVFVQDLSMRGFTAQRGFPIEFNIRGQDWGTLHEKSDEFVKALAETKLVTDLDTDYRLGMPEVRVWPLREKAAEHGVDIDALLNTISTAIGGSRLGKYTSDGRRYDMRISLADDQRVSSENILNLRIRNNHGELIELRNLVKIETIPTLQTITRRNRQRSISVFANIAPGASQAEILKNIEVIGKKILPPGYKVYLGGSAQTFSESFQSLNFVLILGVVIAYMILASQFNSFIHPITVLLALPFSITGAILALAISDQSINLYSMIGVILLMGIVKKNSILLIEFANQLRFEHGLDLKEAILKAGTTRLRPILMTSIACIAAAIPPALALGPGAESRVPMSVAILGGVLISTFFTLLVVPCAYSLFSRLERGGGKLRDLLVD